MPEPKQETYTLSIEELLEMFLDGMMSGVTSTLINVKYGQGNVEAARAESMRQMVILIDDPAVTETIRDTIRARINNEPYKRTVLRVKDFDND